MIGCGGERAVRSLPQWRIRGMKDDALVGNFVVGANSREPEL